MSASATAVRRRPLAAIRLSYDERSAFLFIAPLAIVLFAVAIFPIVYSFYISLFDLKLTRPRRAPFVFFDNYLSVLSDSQFWAAVERTVMFTLMSVVAITIIALLVALLLNEDFRGRRLLGAVVLVPWAIPYVADALMWKWIYNSNYGALNGLLLQLGFIDSYMVWLGDTPENAGADRPGLRLEGSAIGCDPAAGRAQDHPGRSLCRGESRRRQSRAALLPRHAAGAEAESLRLSSFTRR